MPRDHVVQQGECLFSIAKKEGFDDWRTIYGDPANANFRILRPNPNLILPGDVIIIPDKIPFADQIPTGATHTFVVTVQKTLLRLKVDDTRQMKFQLTVGEDQKEGTTDKDQTIEMEIRADADAGVLKSWPAEFTSPEEAGDKLTTWNLKIGHLDPPSAVTGIQARLINLGYDPGPLDGILGPRTKAALRLFQADNSSLKVDGICGPKTTAVLIEKYGI